MNGDAGRMRAPLEMNDHYFGSGCPKVYLSIEECKKSSPHISVSFGFSEYSLVTSEKLQQIDMEHGKVDAEKLIFLLPCINNLPFSL